MVVFIASLVISNNFIRKKLLWTNASPASAFGAQTLNIDLSNYTKYEVEYSKLINNPYLGNSTNIMYFTVGKVALLTDCWYYNAYRQFDNSDATKLVIGGCGVMTSYGNANIVLANDSLVPTKIWGIMGGDNNVRT